MNLALIVSPEGQITELDLDNPIPDLSTLKGREPRPSVFLAFQRAVGGYVEFQQAANGIEFALNEEGKYTSPELNPVATALWHELYPHAGHDYIAGTVVFFGGSSSDGETDTYRGLNALQESRVRNYAEATRAKVLAFSFGL